MAVFFHRNTGNHPGSDCVCTSMQIAIREAVAPWISIVRSAAMIPTLSCEGVQTRCAFRCAKSSPLRVTPSYVLAQWPAERHRIAHCHPFNANVRHRRCFYRDPSRQGANYGGRSPLPYSRNVLTGRHNRVRFIDNCNHTTVHQSMWFTKFLGPRATIVGRNLLQNSKTMGIVSTGQKLYW